MGVNINVKYKVLVGLTVYGLAGDSHVVEDNCSGCMVVIFLL